MKLRIQVVCGDITQVRGDVYAVGHYVGVLPQAAEYALDTVVSPPDAPQHAPRSCTRHAARAVARRSRRRQFYPVGGRLATPCRRRRHGSPRHFRCGRARKLASKLTLEVGALPNVKTICTVLIGSGVGNLPSARVCGVCCLEWSTLCASSAGREDRHDQDRRTRVRQSQRDSSRRSKRFAKDDATTERSTSPRARRDRRECRRDARWSSRRRSRALAFAAHGKRANARGLVRGRESLDEVPGGTCEEARGPRKPLMDVDVAKGVEELAGRLTINVRGTYGRRAGGPFDPDAFLRRPRSRRARGSRAGEYAVVPQRVLRFDLKLFDELAAEGYGSARRRRSRSLGLLTTRCSSLPTSCRCSDAARTHCGARSLHGPSAVGADSRRTKRSTALPSIWHSTGLLRASCARATARHRQPLSSGKAARSDRRSRRPASR